MPDKFSKEIRSKIMSKIRSKNTKPELKLRSLLHKKGYRYKLHDNNLPGKPDIVLKKWKSIIFVHGCFWHSHICKNGNIPKSNKDYWIPKLERNKNRFKVTKKKLIQNGWNVIVVWECQIDNWSDERLIQYINIKILNKAFKR